ncbi:polyprotein [Gossypium australe]|uniref:Polyprotein n=1 Tax=Gossypium australe TaxID=47621 RepID=A0A5B6VAP1_9ROSI|nr:polyprotein [Gossypium australe]
MLRRKGKAIVGNDPDLIKELFEYFHSGLIRGHSGVHVMRHRLSGLIYWKSLSRDVKMWTRECLTCQKCKADLFASLGLLQPLLILNRAWEAISMDFVEGLPKYKGNNVILLTKYVHFLAFVNPFIALTVARDYMRHIYKLHEALESIVSDDDKIFVRYLHCIVGECPKEWLLWLPLAKWWYNTTYHSAIQTTPYEALYVATVDQSLQNHEQARKL